MAGTWAAACEVPTGGTGCRGVAHSRVGKTAAGREEAGGGDPAMESARGADGNLARDWPALDGRPAAGIQPWSSHATREGGGDGEPGWRPAPRWRGGWRRARACRRAGGGRHHPEGAATGGLGR
jgi:hypothetical protein